MSPPPPALMPPSGGADESTAVLESQLELAVGLGHIAIWRHDLVTNRLYYNDEAFKVLDIPARPEGLSLDEVRAFIHPDDVPRVVASAQWALAHDGPTDMEARYRRSDGSWRHVLTRRTVQRAPDGTPIAFVGVALDVTATEEERHRAEQMQRRFEFAIAAAGIGYWSLSEGAERAEWSAALRAMFGLASGEPVPGPRELLERHVHAEDRARLEKAQHEWFARREGQLHIDYRIARADGCVRHLESHSHTEALGGSVLHFGVVLDRTERREAALALRAANERIALVARGAGIGTWERDLSSGISYWDEAMWRLRGREPRPGIIREADWREMTHPDDLASRAGALEEAIRSGAPFEHEFRVIWPDGQVHWLASRSVEMVDESTGARRRIGVNWDVTDKRNHEALVQERELARRESLAKSRFLARMSHELRTPLNAVLGFAQLLADEPAAGDGTASRQQRLGHILAAGRHLLALIDDVLDLSSLESGELRFQAGPVAVGELVEQALAMLPPLLSRPGQGAALPAVSIERGALHGHVLADPVRLRQALLNLLSNAVRYNRDGGRVEISARAGSEPGRLEIVVADTGSGIAEEQLVHLFEPFNRLGRGSSAGPADVPGTGIGLAIVKAVVDRMGGEVRVRSAPGVGSEFTLVLPRAEPPAAEPVAVVTAAVPAQASGQARRSLLYVEDNPVNAQIIVELLSRRADIELHVAPDGARGVEAALRLRPALVLLDMQLPDFDGFEVLRRLRAEPSTAGIRCVALSANAMPEDIERALAAGMSDYWTKPLDFRLFLARLDSLLGGPEA